MWVDYRGSLSTVYNDGEVSICGWIIEVHSIQSTMTKVSQHVGGLRSLGKVYKVQKEKQQRDDTQCQIL